MIKFYKTEEGYKVVTDPGGLNACPERHKEAYVRKRHRKKKRGTNVKKLQTKTT